MKSTWSRTWTGHCRALGGGGIDDNIYKDYRRVDVATGDVNGDFQDEAVLAFWDGCWEPSEETAWSLHGKVQLLVLDYRGPDKQGKPIYDDSLFTRLDPSQGLTDDHVQDVSTPVVAVAATDLDGNGLDEIAVAFSPWLWRGEFRDIHGYHQLRTYYYVPPSPPAWEASLAPHKQGQWHTQSPFSLYSYGILRKDSRLRLALDTSDVDGDGLAEVALARLKGGSKTLEIRTFDGWSDDKIGLFPRGTVELGGPDPSEDFGLAMGDPLGLTIYGDYTGECYATKQAHVTSVIHSPPYWSADNWGAPEAGFGKSVGDGGGSGQTTETKYGGSVKLSPEFKTGPIHFGPSFTYEWEKSCSVETAVMTTTVQGVEFETHPPEVYGEKSYMHALGYDECTLWCYEHTESQGGTPITVCLPRPGCAKAAASLEKWYSEGRGRYADSWVPVGMNLARGRTAQQSSTAYDGAASRAVDGNTDGDYANGSVTFAEAGPAGTAWWEVDLGSAPVFNAVQLWNRTDAAPERLSNFYVLVSEKPITGGDPAVISTDPEVWHYYHPGTVDDEYGSVPMRLQTITWNEFQDHAGKTPERSEELTGRYVRVQLSGTEPLSLAEVQVWGIPAEVEQWPEFEPEAGKKGETYQVTYRDGTKQTIDGKIAWDWNVDREGALLVHDLGSVSFNSTKVKEGDEIEESSSASEFRVGMGIQGVEAEGMSGERQATSRKLTWSEETEFSGTAGILESSEHRYTYAPYIWLQEATSKTGVEHAFLVLDYWVPSIEHAGPSEAAAPQASTLGPVPLVPLIDSASHPDPDTWYHGRMADFTWAQPPGDPATVTGYRWYLDRELDTIPPEVNMGLATSHTYPNLRDGAWYLHVRAKNASGEWGEAAHRAIRVDANPPRVRLALDPPQPTGSDGWYSGPVVVTVTATDTVSGGWAGSGVVTVETSINGVAWQPYAGPLTLDANTGGGTTLWARAADAAGHVSEPVSKTVKIDQTPPSSKTSGGPFPGAWHAAIVTDGLGNEHLVLAGTIEDDHSGPTGLDLRASGTDWSSGSAVLADPVVVPSQPGVEANWHYSATVELGRGNHTFHGAAQDRAGNREEPYELAQVVWFPQSAPDLEGSSLTATPAVVRPGDEVTLVVALRNGGYQEAWVQVTDTLPEGLAPISNLLASDVDYDPGARTLTWPPQLLWPGEGARIHLKVRVDEGLGAAVLENQATAHAFWPNTGDLPARQRRRFEDLEQAVEMTGTVAVNPGLAGDADTTAPWASLYVESGQSVTEPAVELNILAASDARWMYLREWTLNATSGEWVVVQNSGWKAYEPATTWTLSPGDGVKYLGVWVADGTWNVSTLDEHSLAFTNLLAGGDSLADGQRRQYRFEFGRGVLVLYNLVAHQGDPNLYVWEPHHAFRPSHAAENTQFADVVGFRSPEEGVYLFEVLARGDSEYDLFRAHPAEADAASFEASTLGSKERPEHPLAVSDPLSAGPVDPPEPGSGIEIYLPLAFRGS